MNKKIKVAVLPVLAFIGAFLLTSQTFAYTPGAGATGGTGDGAGATGGTGGVGSEMSEDKTLVDPIPDSISVNLKESAFVTDRNSVNDAVLAITKSALSTSGIDTTSYNVYAYCSLVHSCNISIVGSAKYASKAVNLVYSNTPADTSAQTEVANKIFGSLIDFKPYKNMPSSKYFYVFYNIAPIGEEIPTMDVDNEIVSKVRSILGDSYNTYIVSSGPYGQTIYIYKDDVYYTQAVTYVVSGHGYLINSTTPIFTEELAKDSDTYAKMKEELVSRGHATVLSAYELTLGNYDYTGTFPVELVVNSEYNGKNVIVLHLKDDGTYEELEATVENGIVKVETTSLSPFMVALNEASGVGAPDTGAALANDHSGVNTTLIATVIGLGLSLVTFLAYKKSKGNRHVNLGIIKR